MKKAILYFFTGILLLNLMIPEAQPDEVSDLKKLMENMEIRHQAEMAEFCAEHLGHLDEVVWEYFAGAEARGAIRKKVEALFPSEEVDEFTELFWSRVQNWRDDHPGGEPASAGLTERGDAGS